MPEIASLQLFKILSDETRLGIVLLLRRWELCVCDLCTALEQSQPKISRHLAMLRKVAYCWIASRAMGSLSLIPAYSFLGCSGD
jgi:predicted transcriptional regulator